MLVYRAVWTTYPKPCPICFSSPPQSYSAVECCIAHLSQLCLPLQTVYVSSAPSDCYIGCITSLSEGIVLSHNPCLFTDGLTLSVIMCKPEYVPHQFCLVRVLSHHSHPVCLHSVTCSSWSSNAVHMMALPPPVL